MMQAVGDARRIIAELHLGAQIDRAIGATLDVHGRRAEGDRAQRMAACAARTAVGDVRLGAHLPGFTLAVLWSRKARMRRFASLSLCATVAISDSIRRPVCGLASAIIGSACSTAKLVSGAFAATRSAISSALGKEPPASVRYCEKP